MRFCMKLFTLPHSTLLHQVAIRSIHKIKCSFTLLGARVVLRTVFPLPNRDIDPLSPSGCSMYMHV